MAAIITAEHLQKRYKSQAQDAVHAIDFSVQNGEIVGVLGPNGAGKSTLIKMLLGVIRPTAGSVTVLGKDPCHFTNREKKQLGVYLGGKSNLIYHLPVIDSVRLFQSIYQVPKAAFAQNLSRYSSLLQCDPFLNQRVATLSLGQRLRAELLCIMVYDPRLLILDEPTLGLDIEGKRQFRDMLSTLVAQQGLSVVITTHDVNDMQKLCSRILMICEGEKVMDITNDEFEAMLSRQSILITDVTLDPVPEGVQFVERDNHCNRYLLPSDRTAQLRAEIQSCPYQVLKQEPPRLEDILYAYYR